MKKKLLTIIALGALLAANLGADQAGQSWARLYRRLEDLKQKNEILQNITPLDDRSLEPFFLESLNDLVYGDLSKYRESRNTYDDWELLTRTIVKELGDIKGQTAAETVWEVARTAEVPLLKSESLIALGQMRALEYAEPIATMLRNINFNTRSDKDAAEIEAYGAVVALDKLKDSVGFESLFYASIGWYSDRVTDLADEAALTVSGNPVPALDAILLKAEDYRDKRAALNMALRSDASEADKAGIASTALAEGLKYSESDYTLVRQLANLRSDAVRGMIEYGVSDGETAGLLNEAVDEGDMDEKLISLQALGMAGTDEAVTFLADRLSYYNDRQISGLGLNNEELTIVKQLIYALGISGNEIALDPLSQMSYLDYTPALIRESKEAIDRIKN